MAAYFLHNILLSGGGGRGLSSHQESTFIMDFSSQLLTEGCFPVDNGGVEGKMAERSKAHDWKSCVRQNRTEGSNPSLSAEIHSFFIYRVDAAGALCALQECVSVAFLKPIGFTFFLPSYLDLLFSCPARYRRRF